VYIFRSINKCANESNSLTIEEKLKNLTDSRKYTNEIDNALRNECDCSKRNEKKAFTDEDEEEEDAGIRS